MSEENYNLDASAKKLGKMYPILKDAHGNIIDGFHRQNVDPDWPTATVGSVDSPKTLELARLSVNFCRRTMGADELRNRLAFLVGKCGMKPDEISEHTGISVRTIYNHLPQELKDAQKAASGRLGGAATAAGRESAAQVQQVDRVNGAPKQTKCEFCGKPVYYPKYLEVKGGILRACVACEGKYRSGDIALPEPPATPKAFSLKPKETWEHRKAVMQPQVSQMEIRVAAALTAKGVKFESQKPFCLQSTTADFYLPDDNLVVYLDGAPHRGREDRDEATRELLVKRFGVEVLTIPYDAVSAKREAEIVQQILDVMV